MTIQEIVDAANNEGLTYGEYVDKYDPPGEEPEPNPLERICPVCGKAFVVKSMRSRKKYCSVDCNQGAQYYASKMRKKNEKEPEQEHDPVNHPSHYTQGGIECIDAIEAACTGLTGFEGYCIGNAIKYEWRWKQKNGVEDIDKAIWYLKRLRAYLTEDKG